jgi:DNA-binding MarR family transcriptional regulator
MARECVGKQLRMLDRVVTGIYEDELRPLKLKASQMVILVLTATRGEVRAVEIARELQLDASTVSRNVERMRSRGWLEAVPGRDERSRPFRLTARGRA